MYLKASFRHNPSISDIAPYYRLVESYRNESDRVCHKTLLNIGFWADATKEQKDKVVAHLNERYKNELALFDELDEQVMQWVNRFWNEMIIKKNHRPQNDGRKAQACKSGQHQAQGSKRNRHRPDSYRVAMHQHMESTTTY